MKKVTIGAIAVLFLLVGFGYAGAQTQPPQNQLITNMAGPLTSLNLKITYEQELGPTTTLFEGQKLVPVTSLIGKRLSSSVASQSGFKYEDDPVIYMWVDGNGNLSQINITWKPPISPGADKIWTINCRGGNQTGGITGSGTPGLPQIEDGTISTMPRTANNNKTASRTDSIQGVLACSICPDGFLMPDPQTSPPTIIGSTCNGGESYINGYLTFTGTFSYNLLGTETITSASITGTLGGGSFEYIGETWNAPSCTIINQGFECKAIFTGSFAAKLTACQQGDPFCWNEF